MGYSEICFRKARGGARERRACLQATFSLSFSALLFGLLSTNNLRLHETQEAKTIYIHVSVELLILG